YSIILRYRLVYIRLYLIIKFLFLTKEDGHRYRNHHHGYIPLPYFIKVQVKSGRVFFGGGYYFVAYLPVVISGFHLLQIVAAEIMMVGVTQVVHVVGNTL